jgi:hypothetical protein
MATVAGTSGLCRILRQVDALRLPVLRDVAHVEHVDAPDHLVDGAEAELGHDLAQLLGDEHHEVHDVLRLPLEALGAGRDPASRCRPGT